jgi:hypothetical protein
LRRQTGELIEDLRQARLIAAARRCQHEPIGLALEQRHAETLLEKLHHPADRSRRDMQFVGGLGKAFGASGRLERTDPIEEGQLAHGKPSRKLIQSYSRPPHDSS